MVVYFNNLESTGSSKVIVTLDWLQCAHLLLDFLFVHFSCAYTILLVCVCDFDFVCVCDNNNNIWCHFPKFPFSDQIWFEFLLPYFFYFIRCRIFKWNLFEYWNWLYWNWNFHFTEIDIFHLLINKVPFLKYQWYWYFQLSYIRIDLLLNYSLTVWLYYSIYNTYYQPTTYVNYSNCSNIIHVVRGNIRMP